MSDKEANMKLQKLFPFVKMETKHKDVSKHLNTYIN